jgi:hypothetical protein
MKSNLRGILPAIGVAALLASPPTLALAATVKHLPQTARAPSFDTCEALAVERGAGPQQGGNSSNPYIQYNAFMRDCLAGKVPLSPGADTLGQVR